MSTAYPVTVLLARGDSTWGGTRNREMEKMEPGTLVSSPSPIASPFLRGCLCSELPFLLASYLSV